MHDESVILSEDFSHGAPPEGMGQGAVGGRVDAGCPFICEYLPV